MSGPKSLAAAAGLAAALLCGCSYDYIQHTDRIGFRSGDAVRANLERETADPSPRGAYDTAGLGRNGFVRPEASDPKKTGAAGPANCTPSGSGSAASSVTCAGAP